MLKKFGSAMLISALAAGSVLAQTEKIPVESFESIDIAMTGGSVTGSLVGDVAFDDVPEIDGPMALYVEYDATPSTYWSQAAITLPEPHDLTGITELRFSLYFLPSSTTNTNGEVPVRTHLPPDDGYSMDYIHPGEWYEITLKIDPYVAETEMPTFDLFRMVISAGLEGSGAFYVDNIYALRPTNPVALEVVPLYGFNSTNPGASTPLGWTRDQASVDPSLGADLMTPSEGTNCMLLPVTGGAVQAVQTLHAKDDIDWTRVRAIYFDATVTDDFSTWCTVRPYIKSSSGGTTVPEEFRGISGNKGSWRTVSYWLDLGPHMNSIIGDGDFAIGIRNDNGGEANSPDAQNILIDNFRVGMVSSFCLAVRDFGQNASIYEGSSGSYPVTVSLTMKGDAAPVEMVEMLPEGWSATDISNGGVLADGTITWNLDVSPDAVQTLSYTAVSPASISKKPVWSGSVNGETVFGSAGPAYFDKTVTDTLVEAPLLSNTVTLDGVISAGEYDGANVYTFNHDTSDGNKAPGVHLSGKEYPAAVENMTFHVFHDADYIYVAADVVDPDLSFEFNDIQFWNADSAEVYFDGNLSRSNAIESERHGCQLTVVGDGRLAASNNKYFPTMLDAAGGGKYMEDGRDGADQPVYWACGAKASATGYVVEYRVAKAQILDPANRTQIGFEVMVNSSEAASAATRTGKWGYHCSDASGVPFEAYNNESGWTLMNLLGTSVNDWSVF